MSQSAGTEQAVLHLWRTVSVLLLSADRRVSPRRTMLWSICSDWSDQVSHIQIHLLSIYTVHLIMRAGRRPLESRLESHVSGRCCLHTVVEISHFFLKLGNVWLIKSSLQLTRWLTLPDLYNCMRSFYSTFFFLRSRTALVMVMSAINPAWDVMRQLLLR